MMINYKSIGFMGLKCYKVVVQVFSIAKKRVVYFGFVHVAQSSYLTRSSPPIALTESLCLTVIITEKGFTKQNNVPE